MKAINRKILYFLVILLPIGAGGAWFFLSPMISTATDKKISKMAETNPELDRLIQLIQKYSHSDIKIKADGLTYTPKQVLAKTRKYLLKKYKGETAEDWIKKYGYVSLKEGGVIYFVYPDGKAIPMRDVFLKDLAESTT